MDDKEHREWVIKRWGWIVASKGKDVHYDERESKDVPDGTYQWPWQRHSCYECKRHFIIEGSYKEFNGGGYDFCPDCVVDLANKRHIEEENSRWDEIA